MSNTSHITQYETSSNNRYAIRKPYNNCQEVKMLWAHHSIKKKFVPRVILVFMLAVASYNLLCVYNPSLTTSPKNKTKNIREKDTLFS